ncbi:hypothetical protein J5X84_00755 [Streptosporangiaceae bacterium NEAU-GS5]|nr:hypothetical protein [Streptosporangiaceae bacterium NEAU-GS5]
MRKSLRLTLAAATGAAVLATGAAIAVASPASARDAGAISAITLGADKFLPPTGSSTLPFSFKLENAYGTGTTVQYKVWAQYTKDNSGSATWSNASITQPAGTIGSAQSAGTTTEINGSIPLSSSDVPGDKWQLRVAATATSATTVPDTAWEKSGVLTIVRATRVTGVSIDPSPVVLKSGTDVDVYVEAKLDFAGGEKLTAVDLESKDDDDSYALGTNGLEDNGDFHDSTSFDYSTDTGAWQVDFTITRGAKTYHFVKNFDVKKSTASAGKAKSKIKLAVKPNSVKKGKTFKLYGQAYRGYSSWGAWGKKILRVYFKKKGTTTWKFVGYIETTSTGKFSHTYKPKYSGYWRVYGAGTSKTNKAYSNYKAVTVK